MANETMTLTELAAELNRSPATLRRSWQALHRRHGFPRPLPGLGLVWSRALVMCWIRAAGLGLAQPANDDRLSGIDPASLIEAQRRALRDAMR